MRCSKARPTRPTRWCRRPAPRATNSWKSAKTREPRPRSLRSETTKGLIFSPFFPTRTNPAGRHSKHRPATAERRKSEMAAIAASMVAELRAKTDAPMMECKKALTEAEGNLDKAEELLRVKLGNKAGKAASRITAEGVVSAFVDGTTGALVEVNCETDFVSKNDSFLAFTKAMAKLIAENKPSDVAALSALPYSQ